ncbi:MAG: hypothetical protein KA802_12470, partial [Saprospiraceae bacterium]|nr:hypothetical protein [Saprospiraceae bacterium]
KKRMPQTLHSTFAPKVKGQKRNIRFRNFLAIAMNEDLKGQTYIDNGFYVANISRVKMNKIEPNHKHFWVYSKVTIK